MIIIPPGQEVLVEIEDAKFWITPLTSGQRAQITHFKKTKSGEQIVDTDKLARLALRYGVKRVEGVYNIDGTKFEFDFSAGYLSDAHCDLLIEGSVHVHLLAVKLSQGTIPMIEGIKFTSTNVKKKRRKKRG